MDEAIKIAVDTLQKNKQAIIFVASRASAEKTAEDIAKLTTGNLQELEQLILAAASTPTKQCKRLAQCIKKSIAFHHAGLLAAQRELIEEQFRAGKIRIICATPTLAAGLSLPVFRVIIRSLKRYHQRLGNDWIPVLEYLQMAGRAGRPEYEAYGEAISLAKDKQEKEEIYNRYICGIPEDIYSKLAVEPVLRTYLLSLIASGIITDRKTMREFFAKTFWAHQFKDMDMLESILEKMLSLLQEWGFITTPDEKNTSFISAQKLTTPSQFLATIIGQRISELYLDPLTARYIINCLMKFTEQKTPFSLLQMVSHTLEMRPLLTVKTKDYEKIQNELAKRYEQLLETEPTNFDAEYDEFMNSIKTALFFLAWIDEQDEDYLLEYYDIRPGEIHAKRETADWLLYASEELAKINSFNTALREIHKLRIRLEYGVREELLPILQLKGIGRVRARKLFSQGIHTIGDVKKMDITSLSQILSRSIAEDIKKQLGWEITEIPKGTRKGQLSLEKF